MDAFMGTMLHQCKTQLSILSTNHRLQSLFQYSNTNSVRNWRLDFVYGRIQTSQSERSEHRVRVDALFITCILTELFLYCYYGNEVTVESERVLQSLYGMEWLHTPLRFKRSLLLDHAARAAPAAGPPPAASSRCRSNTFVTILKSSYTFYAVLRQTKQ
ncbi:hypothetical protein ACJJTC_011159 [Scirpophaga incertulas]